MAKKRQVLLRVKRHNFHLSPFILLCSCLTILFHMSEVWWTGREGGVWIVRKEDRPLISSSQSRGRPRVPWDCPHLLMSALETTKPSPARPAEHISSHCIHLQPSLPQGPPLFSHLRRSLSPSLVCSLQVLQVLCSAVLGSLVLSSPAATQWVRQIFSFRPGETQRQTNMNGITTNNISHTIPQFNALLLPTCGMRRVDSQPPTAKVFRWRDISSMALRDCSLGFKENLRDQNELICSTEKVWEGGERKKRKTPSLAPAAGPSWQRDLGGLRYAGVWLKNASH